MSTTTLLIGLASVVVTGLAALTALFWAVLRDSSGTDPLSVLDEHRTRGSR